jgi:hypothetical protein
MLGTLTLVGLGVLLGQLWDFGKKVQFTKCVWQKLQRWRIPRRRSGVGDAEEDGYERGPAESDPLLR